MPRTLDHITDMHRIATDRRAAGQPVWDGTLRLRDHLNSDAADDFDGEGFTATRTAIVAAVRAHPWFTRQDEFSDLHEVVDGLADAEDCDEFNGWLDELYDLADYDRIWIA